MTDRRPPDARDDVDWGDLIGRMARADETALTRFYDGTSRLVYGLAVRITRDPAAAEELTLAVYCQAWRQAKAYSPARRSPTSWLFTLARSRALDQLRSRIRRDQGREEALEAAGGLADAGSVELAYFAGLSQSEIAARTGQPLGILLDKAGLLIARSPDLPWQPQGSPGVSIKVLFTDPERDYITALGRMEPGTEYPRHRHDDVEELYVLEGDLVVEGHVMRPGDYCRAEPDSIHGETRSETGCLFLMMCSRQDELLGRPAS